MAKQKIEGLENETKEDKFRRLATKRVNAAIQKISLIGNLGSAQYGKTDEQIQAIEVALSDAVVNTMAQLHKTKVEKTQFAL